MLKFAKNNALKKINFVTYFVEVIILEIADNDYFPHPLH